MLFNYFGISILKKQDISYLAMGILKRQDISYLTKRC